MAEVSAKVGKDGEVVTVNYDWGSTLKDAVAKFKEDVVFANFKAAGTVALQGYMRSLIKQDKKPAEIQNLVNEWTPGVRAPGKSPAEKAKEQLAKLSPEQRKAILAELAKAA